MREEISLPVSVLVSGDEAQLPPDLSLRKFRVQFNPDDFSTIEGHGVDVTTTGALVINKVVAGQAYTVAVFAPGVWIGVEAEVPDRASVAKQLATMATYGLRIAAMTATAPGQPPIKKSPVH